MSKDNRLCKLSDYAEGWDMADDDAYDSYIRISDTIFNSPEGGEGTILLAPHSHDEAVYAGSIKTTLTDPRSRFYFI